MEAFHTRTRGLDPYDIITVNVDGVVQSICVAKWGEDAGNVLHVMLWEDDGTTLYHLQSLRDDVFEDTDTIEVS
jgi:hypothetical protein